MAGGQAWKFSRIKLVQPAFCGDCAVEGEAAGLRVAGIDAAGLGITPGAAGAAPAGDIPGATGCVTPGGWPGTVGGTAPGWAGLAKAGACVGAGGGGGGGFWAKALRAIVAETREAMSNVFIG